MPTGRSQATGPTTGIITTLTRRPAITTTTATTESAAPPLLRLLAWLSPSFPIGAFGWSHGLELAIANGDVRDAATLLDWITALLEGGGGWSDLVVFAETYREVAAGGDASEVARLAEALGTSAERRAETLALGLAFAEAARPWGAAAGRVEPYPVAVARLCAAHGVPLADALLAFAHAFAANLVSVAVRLVPLGQSRAAETLHALEPVIARTAARAARSTLDDLEQRTLWSDIAAMRHETLQPRLFRS